MKNIAKNATKNLVISKITRNFATQKQKDIQKLAKIAQLVEHNLAKVGVAGSSPVFRSNPLDIPLAVEISI